MAIPNMVVPSALPPLHTSQMEISTPWGIYSSCTRYIYVFICSIFINILFKDFVDNGANLRQQKNFQNVVNSPLLTGDESTKVIEIISVPELHLLLGRLPYKVYIHIFYSGIVAKFIKEIQAKVFMCKNSGKKFMDRFLKKVLIII